MNKSNFIVLLIVVILLGIGTGFIIIDFANTGLFLVTLISIFYKGFTGGPGGNSGTGNEEKSTP